MWISNPKVFRKLTFHWAHMQAADRFCYSSTYSTATLTKCENVITEACSLFTCYLVILCINTL